MCSLSAGASLKGSWQLSSPAGSLNLNEIPRVKGKRSSVEITSIRTIEPKLLELKDVCAFLVSFLSSDPNAYICE